MRFFVGWEVNKEGREGRKAIWVERMDIGMNTDTDMGRRRKGILGMCEGYSVVEVLKLVFYMFVEL